MRFCNFKNIDNRIIFMVLYSKRFSACGKMGAGENCRKKAKYKFSCHNRIDKGHKRV